MSDVHALLWSIGRRKIESKCREKIDRQSCITQCAASVRPDHRPYEELTVALKCRQSWHQFTAISLSESLCKA